MDTVFCPNCFAQGYEGRCEHCGYLGISQADNHMLLRPGLVLHGRYLLGRALGAGGFGITYLAKDRQDGALCAIKEYLPSMLAVRDPDSRRVYASSKENRETFDHDLSVFNRESQVLSRFAGNPSIVQVRDCFQENGTAYFAMEYLDGVNLMALTRSMGGKLPAQYGREILTSVAGTLKAVHAQELLHRDVSPENIFMTKLGQIKLIDFGATRFFVGERSRSLSVILKPGFAPPEQYSSKGNQGPWTDIYALCATIYNVLTGRPVPDAPERLGGAAMEPLSALVPGIETAVSDAVERGLLLDYRNRPQSVDEFLRDAEGRGQQAAVSPPRPAPSGHSAAPGPPKPSEQPAPPPLPVQVRGVPYLQMMRAGKGGDKWIIPRNMAMAIGRASDRCNIVLDEPNVSRVHCTVLYDERANVFYVTDVSSNGTLIEAGRMESNKAYALEPGEMFYILTRDTAMKVGLE